MSLFGNTSNASTGGLFGSKPATTTTSAPATGGLFGAAATPASTTTASTGLFGAKPATTAAPASGGLFGAAASKPATGGLFGAAATTTATTAAPASGGLFGTATTTATTTAAPASGGLFGTANTTTTTAAPASGGLFGTATTTAAKPAVSMFGATTQPSTGLFGAAAPTAAQGVGAATTTTGAKTSGSLNLNMADVRGTTKFEDLSKESQDGIIQMDNIISVIMGWKAEIEAFLPGHGEEISNLANDVSYLQRKFGLVQRAVLEEDVAHIQELRTMSNKNILDAELVTRAVDNLKLPANYHVPGLFSHTNAPTAAPAAAGEPDLISYFNNQADVLSDREKKLRGYISEIQAHMPRVEHGLYEKLTQLQATPGMSHQATTLEQLKQVLLDLRSAIVTQAVSVAKTREMLMTLEQQVTGINRHY